MNNENINISENTQTIKGVTVIKKIDKSNGFYWFMIEGKMSKVVNVSLKDYSHNEAYEMYMKNGFLFNQNF